MITYDCVSLIGPHFCVVGPPELCRPTELGDPTQMRQWSNEDEAPHNVVLFGPPYKFAFRLCFHRFERNL